MGGGGSSGGVPRYKQEKRRQIQRRQVLRFAECRLSTDIESNMLSALDEFTIPMDTLTYPERNDNRYVG